MSQSEAGAQQLKERDALIEQLVATTHDMERSAQDQQRVYTEGIRKLQSESASQISLLEARLLVVEQERTALVQERDSLGGQLQATKDELEKFLITDQMQNEELQRLNLSIGGLISREQDGARQISKESMIRMAQKLDEFKFAILEKERELQVLHKEKAILQESHGKQLQASSEENQQLRDALTLLKRETESLRQSLDQLQRLQMADPSHSAAAAVSDSASLAL